MSPASFQKLFVDDLTSLYSVVIDRDIRRTRYDEGGPPAHFHRASWEHNRMKDVAGLRLFFSEDASPSKKFLSEMSHSEYLLSSLLSRKRVTNALRRKFPFHWVTSITNDRIEIAFSISGSKDYFEFLMDDHHSASMYILHGEIGRRQWHTL